MGQRQVLVVEHDHVSPPGALGEAFVDRGLDVAEHRVVAADRFLTPDVTTDFPDPLDYDALVVMGAPWSAYDDAQIGSWVRPELDLLRRAAVAGLPVLGICFGGQLLALAHGGQVARAPLPEIGWSVVTSDDESLVQSGAWFQWHYDRWTLPPGAIEIARTAAASQAFVVGRHLAVQFHPELDTGMLDGWYANGGREQVALHGLDPDVLREHTRRLEGAGHRRVRHLVDAFLDRVSRREHPAPRRPPHP